MNKAPTPSTQPQEPALPPPERPWAGFWTPITWLAFLLAAPYYAVGMLFSAKYRIGLPQRMTRYPKALLEQTRGREVIWVHTVSVGELMAARPLLRQIKTCFPGCCLLVSTVTNTGQAQAHKLECVDAACYLPLDLAPLCRRAVRRFQPRAVLILETELWPNLIRAVRDAGVPLFLLNARLSDQSFKNYRRTRALFRPLLSRFHAILVQSQQDADRFAQLGVSSQRLRIMGNLKFDVEAPASLDPQRRQWRKRFCLDEAERLWLAGSTFEGEEAMLARVMQAVRKQGHPLRLVIAPRHIERVPAIVAQLRQAGSEPVLRSQLEQAKAPPKPEQPILLDTIGELGNAYAAADLVFIGKTIHARGGQNPIEPAAWGRAILMGPNMQNFRDVAALLLRAQAAVQVNDEAALQTEVAALCQDEPRRAQLGERARQVVQQNQGALAEAWQCLEPVLRQSLNQEQESS